MVYNMRFNYLHTAQHCFLSSDHDKGKQSVAMALPFYQFPSANDVLVMPDRQLGCQLSLSYPMECLLTSKGNIKFYCEFLVWKQMTAKNDWLFLRKYTASSLGIEL